MILIVAYTAMIFPHIKIKSRTELFPTTASIWNKMTSFLYVLPWKMQVRTTMPDISWAWTKKKTQTFCLIDNWFPINPLSGVFCEDIGQVEHATRVLTGTDGSNSILGTTATFTCDANYQMTGDGDASRTCQDDGTWSGTQPRCVGKQAALKTHSTCCSYSSTVFRIFIHSFVSCQLVFE